VFNTGEPAACRPGGCSIRLGADYVWYLIELKPLCEINVSVILPNRALALHVQALTAQPKLLWLLYQIARLPK
jgi:hypothetical protein